MLLPRDGNPSGRGAPSQKQALRGMVVRRPRDVLLVPLHFVLATNGNNAETLTCTLISIGPECSVRTPSSSTGTSRLLCETQDKRAHPLTYLGDNNGRAAHFLQAISDGYNDHLLFSVLKLSVPTECVRSFRGLAETSEKYIHQPLVEIPRSILALCLTRVTRPRMRHHMQL